MYKCINITQFPDTYTHVIHACMHIYAPTYLLIFVQIVNGHREISDFESKGDKLCHIIKSSYSYPFGDWEPLATAMARRRDPLALEQNKKKKSLLKLAKMTKWVVGYTGLSKSKVHCWRIMAFLHRSNSTHPSRMFHWHWGQSCDYTSASEATFYDYGRMNHVGLRSNVLATTKQNKTRYHHVVIYEIYTAPCKSASSWLQWSPIVHSKSTSSKDGKHNCYKNCLRRLLSKQICHCTHTVQWPDGRLCLLTAHTYQSIYHVFASNTLHALASSLVWLNCSCSNGMGN